MAINYTQLTTDVRALIKDLGTTVTVTHLDGGSSKGYIVFSTTTQADGDTAHVSTTQTTQRVAFIDTIKVAPCVGDTALANKIIYRIEEVTPYNPAGTTVGYKVLLDS